MSGDIDKYYGSRFSLENYRIRRERGDVFFVLRGDLDSELFQALEEVAFQLVRLDPVQIVRSQFAIGALGFEPMVHTHQDAMAYGHKRPFLTLASRSATKPRRQIGRFGVGGRPRGLALAGACPAAAGLHSHGSLDTYPPSWPRGGPRDTGPYSRRFRR
jgi:hypothetical protein